MVKDARFIKERTITDTYYDSADYKLTSKDYCLRQRDGKFELKVPLNEENIHERITDQYKELEIDAEIARELSINIKTSLTDAIVEAGFVPFTTIKTNRISYRNGYFNLDFDEMDFGFSTMEMELIVESVEAIPLAEERIVNFAKKHDISATFGHGKVIEYLQRYRPEHYSVLVQSGVVID